MVDWKKLKHARGPATRVPLEVEALVAKADRDTAYFTAVDTLVSAGKWFAASAPALELLGALFGTAKPDSHRALWLAGDIVAGDHLWALASAVSPPAKSGARAEVEGVASGLLDKAGKLLAHKAAPQRSAAAFFLAFAAPPSKAWVDVIAPLAANDKVSEVRASAVLALGTLAKRGSKHARDAVADISKADGLVAGAWWLAKVLAQLPVAKSEAEKGIASWVGATLDPESMPWGRRIWDTVVDAVVTDEKARAALAGPMLTHIAREQGVAIESRFFVTDVALRLAGFTSQFAEDDVAEPAELTQAQREAALGIALFPDAAAIKAYGLPSGDGTIPRWLGAAPATPLEKPAKKGAPPRWLVCRKLIAAKKKADVVAAAAFEGLGPVDTLEVMAALSTHDYRIDGDGELRLGGPAFDAAITSAGKPGIEWARGYLDRLAEKTDAVSFAGTTAAMAALGAAARAKVELSPAWDVLIGPYPIATSGEILSAMPAARRHRVALGWAQKRPPFTLIEPMRTHRALVSSKELVAAVSEWPRDAAVKANGLVPQAKLLISELSRA